jgi:hypothetical protein
MNRRVKLVILIILLFLAGDAAVWLWLPSEPDVVAKAKTLRQGMTEKEVFAVLDMNEASGVSFIGSPGQARDIRNYRHYSFDCGDHDWRELWSSKFPFILPQRYWTSRAGTLDVIFVGTIDDKEAKLMEIYFTPRPSVPVTRIQLLPPKAATSGPGRY